MSWAYETDFKDKGLLAQTGIEDLIFVRNETLVTIEEHYGGSITVDPTGKGLVKADPPCVLSDEEPGLMIRFNPGVLGQVTVRIIPNKGETPRVTYTVVYPSRYGSGYTYEFDMPGDGTEFSYASSPPMTGVRIVGAALDYLRIDVY